MAEVDNIYGANIFIWEDVGENEFEVEGYYIFCGKLNIQDNHKYIKGTIVGKVDVNGLNDDEIAETDNGYLVQITGPTMVDINNKINEYIRNEEQQFWDEVEIHNQEVEEEQYED